MNELINCAADIVFFNGPVITVNSKNEIADAVAVKGNKINFIGNEKEIKHHIDEHTKVIDLKGRSLIPGLIDSHLHTAIVGVNSLAMDCRSPGVSSIEDIKDLIREVVKVTPKGKWIRGWGYDDSKLDEKRHPNRWDLDDVAPDNPVVITRVCCHISTHNSKSLQLAGLADNAPDPVGGLRDRENGVINGVMKENAHMQISKISAPSKEEITMAMVAANDMLIKEGITSISDSGGFGHAQMGAIQDAVEQKKLKIRMNAMIFTLTDNLPMVEDFLKIGIHTGFGNDNYKLGPLKIMIDGSSSGPTASTLKPYASNPNFSGILAMTQEQVDDIILRAHSAGWQVTSHAVGDKAVTMIVDAIEKALKKYPRENHRHRIEHCAMINEELLDRIKKLGIVPISNPIFLYEFGDGYMVNYGKERAGHMFTAKSFIDKGIIAAGSSDCPVTFSSPILNMHVAVNRKTQTGQEINVDERISIEQALRMFTYNGAYASFDENKKGTVEVGKLADLVVLSGSLYDTPIDKIKDLNVHMTMIDGEIVYQNMDAK